MDIFLFVQSAQIFSSLFLYLFRHKQKQPLRKRLFYITKYILLFILFVAFVEGCDHLIGHIIGWFAVKNAS